ncbi:MAG TPA: VacJ family lipoprotein [Chromatiaceae bacterium]|nr:VacJ family lipoprotein [Chromatiaceae bacterium]
MRRNLPLVLLLILGIAPSLPLVAADMDDEFADLDPWIRVNRMTHNLNDVGDRILLRPVAVGYRKMFPRFVRRGIGNAFSNLHDVSNAINNMLQGKLNHGVSDLARVLVNSTVGLAGLFDPASSLGMVEHEEDWGQTFAKWGSPTGPYLVIPGLGPGSVRDGLSRILDSVTDPVRYLYPVSDRNVTYAARLVRNRADLLAVESVAFGDKYIFYRGAYLQRREYLVNDGVVSDPFADDF